MPEGVKTEGPVRPAHFPDRGVAVINYVDSRDHDALVERLRSWGADVVHVDGAEAVDKQTVLEAFGGSGMLSRPPRNWESLADILAGAVQSMSSQAVAVVWTDAHRMLEGGLSDLITAADILTEISREMTKAGRIFVTYLEGTGANFPRLAD